MNLNSEIPLQQRIQSLQHSLLFLQGQHASTLNGLHAEIAKLQQKCAALTHKLTQSGFPVLEVGDQTEPSLIDTLEDELKQSRLQHAKFKESLESKETRILMFEAQSKSKEQKYLNDLNQYQRRVAELENELEHKSASIAYLSTKLHQNKLKDNIVNDAVASGTVNFNPTPPTGNPSRQHERKNIRSAVNSPAANVTGMVVEGTSRQVATSDYVLLNSLPKNTSNRLPTRYKHSKSDPSRPAVGHSQTKRERDIILFNRPKPSDYEDFIKISQLEEIVAKPLIEPLPPITPHGGRQLRQSRTKSHTNKNSKVRVSSSGEVETIIVETPLSSPERPYGKLQDLS